MEQCTSPLPPPPTPHIHPLTPLQREQKVTYKAQLQPIRKKLNKCRDPDRWNLVELQRSRREQVLNKGGGGGGGGSEDGGEGVAGAKKDDDVFGGDAKRRKVAKGAALDDPFGGAL